MRRALRTLISVLSAVALVMVIGWAVVQLGRLYLNVLGQPGVIKNTSNNDNQRQILRLEGFQVWYLQYGLFANQESANKLVNDLAQKGVKAVVLRGQPYRVVSGYFGQQQAAKAEGLFIGLKGVRPLAKSLTVNGISFKITSGNAEQIKTLLVNYGQILSTFSSNFNQADSSQLSTTKLSQLATQVQMLRAQTAGPVKDVAGQSKEAVREATLKLDNQGAAVADSMKVFVQDRIRVNYQQVQIELLQLLNTYWEFVELLQK